MDEQSGESKKEDVINEGIVESGLGNRETGTRHLVNVHEVKPVRLIKPMCAVCGSDLAVLNLFVCSAALRGGCQKQKALSPQKRGAAEWQTHQDYAEIKN